MSLASREEEELEIAQGLVAGARLELSQASTHLRVCFRQFKAPEGLGAPQYPSPVTFHTWFNSEKNTMGVFYSTVQVRKGK